MTEDTQVAPRKPMNKGVEAGSRSIIGALVIYLANSYLPQYVGPEIQAIATAGVLALVGFVGSWRRDWDAAQPPAAPGSVAALWRGVLTLLIVVPMFGCMTYDAIKTRDMTPEEELAYYELKSVRSEARRRNLDSYCRGLVVTTDASRQSGLSENILDTINADAVERGEEVPPGTYLTLSIDSARLVCGYYLERRADKL